MTIHACIFENDSAADDAVTELLAAGFPERDIHVVSKRPFGRHVRHVDVHNLAPSGAHTRRALLVGALIGAALGGIAAVVVVRVRGGPGMLLVGSVVAAALAGALVGSYVAAMSTRGYEPAIADFHDQALGRDQYLVALELDPADRRVAAAEAVLARGGSPAMRMRAG
ncbi:MAG: hypothetical protein EPO68_17380 [Planctomycetota bacterium]|nr:MAG: hypothetical protein EPO68_17380 [Planctomycetota bacterium]